jgi:glycosyltransferase involved in cell wall biosynthesis
MKIVIISQFFFESMGYTENILPKYLSKLGHEVIVISSNSHASDKNQDYASNYGAFLGDSEQPIGQTQQDGFLLKRLEGYSVAGYVGLKNLRSEVNQLKPDIVQFIQVSGISNYSMLLTPFNFSYAVFTECHQHASIAKNFNSGEGIRGYIDQFWYRITRSIPTLASHTRVEKCFAISPDCEIIANKLYGVPVKKIVPLSLGTDTEVFHPATSQIQKTRRKELRTSLGVTDDQILVVYTGRFTQNKNPLILAKAIEILHKNSQKFKALFVGSGEQQDAIIGSKGCQVMSFQQHGKLAQLYRASDVGIWPREESMSMLDASSSGLPLIVSNKMGDLERILGNGLTYEEGNIGSLVEALNRMESKSLRDEMSQMGVEKMIKSYSWIEHAKTRLEYYETAISSQR